MTTSETDHATGAGRTISDADARQIATELKRQLLSDLYTEAGKGFIASVKKAAVLILILIVVYGAAFELGVRIAAPPHVGAGQ